MMLIGKRDGELMRQRGANFPRCKDVLEIESSLRFAKYGIPADTIHGALQPSNSVTFEQVWPRILHTNIGPPPRLYPQLL